jgi:hypothetical protein
MAHFKQLHQPKNSLIKPYGAHTILFAVKKKKKRKKK